MPWPFGTALAQSKQRAMNRHERRRAKQQAAQRAQPLLLFETLEQRVLLNGAVPPVGTILSSDTAPGIVQDADGTSFNVGLTGGGHWQVTQGASGPLLQVTATTSSSVIALQTSGGDGRFLLTGIDVEGPAQSLTGTAIDLNGPLTLNGRVGALFLGDVDANGGSPVSDNGGRFAAGKTTVGDTAASNLTIQNGGRLITAPNAGASGPAAAIAASAGSGGSQVSVTGTNSLWQVDGQLVVGGADNGSLSITGGASVVAGSMDAALQASGSGVISVVGTGSKLSVTGQLLVGDAGSADLAILNGAVVTAASGEFGVQAGGTGVVDIEGNGSTLNITGSLIIGGNGSAVVVLGAGTQLNVSDNLIIGPGGVLDSFGGFIGSPALTAPAVTAALANDTGLSATDKVTTDATVTGQATAANGIATLRVGINGIADAQYLDLTDALAADGSYTLTPAQLTALNGGTLPDGRYVLHLIATDDARHPDRVDVTITLQTAAPTVSGFGLAQSSAVPGRRAATRRLRAGLADRHDDAGSDGDAGRRARRADAGRRQRGVPVRQHSGAQGDNAFTVTGDQPVGCDSTGRRDDHPAGHREHRRRDAMEPGHAEHDRGRWRCYPPDASRLLAIVSLAQYDTLAAIEGTAGLYGSAARSAARCPSRRRWRRPPTRCWSSLFPVRKPIFDAALATSLAGIPTARR